MSWRKCHVSWSILSGRDTGSNGVPEAGDEFVVVPDEKSAREVATFRKSVTKITN